MNHSLHPADAYAAVEFIQQLLLRNSRSGYFEEAAHRALDNLIARIDPSAPLERRCPAETLARKALCNARKTVRQRWRHYQSSSNSGGGLNEVDIQESYDEPLGEEATPKTIVYSACSSKWITGAVTSEPWTRVQDAYDSHTLLQLATPAQQEILVRRLEDWDDAAIAADLRLSTCSVASAASRGIDRIRTAMAQLTC